MHIKGPLMVHPIATVNIYLQRRRASDMQANKRTTKHSHLMHEYILFVVGFAKYKDTQGGLWNVS